MPKDKKPAKKKLKKLLVKNSATPSTKKYLFGDKDKFDQILHSMAGVKSKDFPKDE